MLHVPPSDAITGSGTIVSQAREVEFFRGIRIDGFGKVFITQGPSQALRVDADDNVIDQVTTAVRGGVLLLDVAKKTSYSDVTIDVFVTAPDLEMLEIAGAGEIQTESPIQVEELVCNLTGAGTIRLSGSADLLDVKIGGSGDIRCFDLAARNCRAVINGMGSCEVYVTGSLDAVITGMGNIVYDGNPESVTQKVTGMGSVRGR